jgi:hypothetical protein
MTELKEYEHLEQMVRNKKKLILSAPEGKNIKIQDSPEFAYALRQELTNYVNLKEYRVLEDKYFQKLEDNKILLEKIHEIERNLK